MQGAGLQEIPDRAAQLVAEVSRRRIVLLQGVSTINQGLMMEQKGSIDDSSRDDKKAKI